MSERSDFTASANVRVTIEVQNLGPYGADWTAEKIHEQTGKEAMCGRKAELGSSRCAVCGPAARDRAAARTRQREYQHALLARLGC